MIQTSGDRLAKDVLHFIQIHDDDDRDRDDRFVFSSEMGDFNQFSLRRLIYRWVVVRSVGRSHTTSNRCVADSFMSRVARRVGKTPRGVNVLFYHHGCH